MNIALSPKKAYVRYPSVDLLSFRVDGLGLSTTDERLEAFSKLAFPRQLKALKQYLRATGFLRHLIPYYAQLVEPLQKRKTALLVEGRKARRTDNINKRQAFVRNVYYEPTEQERAS